MRRKKPPPEPELESLLGPYRAVRVPKPVHDGLRSARCRKCKQLTLFEARHPSTVCRWCGARL